MFYVVKVETVGACTRKCNFCKFGSGFNNNYKLLSWNIIKKILLELKEKKFSGRLSWFGMNEPLLDKRIYDIIKISRRYLPNAFLSLQTNGDLLDLDKANILYRNGLDYLGVSIYDNKTFIKINDIINNKTFIGRIIIKDYRNINFMNLENRGGNIKSIKFFNKNEIISMDCKRPSSVLYINYLGNIKLCEGDLNNSNINFSIGNDNIYNIWNYKEFILYREKLKKYGRKGLIPCENCSYIGYRSNPYFPLKHPDTF